MLETKYRCKLITPMFMYGAYNFEKIDSKDRNKSIFATPEIRTASIKGVMRYVWRAAQAASDEDSYKLMIEQEKILFGSVHGDARQSGLRLQIIDIPKQQSDNRNNRPEMLPHRKDDTKKMRKTAYPADTEFNLVIRTLGKNQVNHNLYETLFELTAQIAGFGARSRRCSGSIKILTKDEVEEITPQSVNDVLRNIHKNLTKISKCKYVLENNEISYNTSGNIRYPYIKKISISSKQMNTAEKVRIDVGELSSSNQTLLLGSISKKNGQKRYASPVYVSVIQISNMYHAIVTQLSGKSPNYVQNIDAAKKSKQAFINGVIGT